MSRIGSWTATARTLAAGQKLRSQERSMKIQIAMLIMGACLSGCNLTSRFSGNESAQVDGCIVAMSKTVYRPGDSVQAEFRFSSTTNVNRRAALFSRLHCGQMRVDVLSKTNTVFTGKHWGPYAGTEMCFGVIDSRSPLPPGTYALRVTSEDWCSGDVPFTVQGR